MRGKILVLIGIFLILISCREKGESLKREKVIPVTVTTPFERNIVKEIVFTADIEGNPDVYVYPEIPGYFLKYEVKEGERVEKDEIIAYIERRIPGMEYKPIPVKSPISGYVSELLRENGEFVNQTKPVARVARYENLFATLSLPGKYAEKIKKGERADIFLEDGRKTYGNVEWISKTLDPFTKTIKVKILFKNPGGVYPGMVCEVKLPIEKKNGVLSVERDAILGDVIKYVFVKEGNVAKKKIIKTGIENEEYVEIIEGLDKGDTVILKGNRILKEGMRIEVKEE